MSEIENVYQYMSDLTEVDRYCFGIPYYQTKHIYSEYEAGPRGELQILIDQYEDHAKGESLVGKLPKLVTYEYCVQIMKPLTNIQLKAVIGHDGILKYI